MMAPLYLQVNNPWHSITLGLRWGGWEGDTQNNQQNLFSHVFLAVTTLTPWYKYSLILSSYKLEVMIFALKRVIEFDLCKGSSFTSFQVCKNVKQAQYKYHGQDYQRLWMRSYGKCTARKITALYPCSIILCQDTSSAVHHGRCFHNKGWIWECVVFKVQYCSF